MNAYTVTTRGIVAGIAVDANNTIHVGEEGRGRKLVRVPVPPGAVVEEHRLVSIPGLQGDVVRVEKGVVVLVQDHSGYRGGWRPRAAHSDTDWDTAVAGVAPGASLGHLLPPEVLPSWIEIARGECAQGDAGRMGGGPCFLVVLQPGTGVELVRSGRLYGEPTTVVVRYGADGVLTRSYPRREAETRLAAGKW